MTIELLLYAVGSPTVGYGHIARSSEVYREAIGIGLQATYIAELQGVTTSTIELPPGVLISTSERESLRLAHNAVSAASAPPILLTDLPERRITRAAQQIRSQCRGAVILNATCESHPEATLAVVRGTSECEGSKPSMIGWGYEVVRLDVRALRPAAPSLRNELNRILVTFGGADPGELTEKFLEQWRARDGFRALVVLGQGFSNDRLASLPQYRSDHIEIVHAPQNFPQLLKECDGVVLQGGQTMVESMCLGTPVFGVRWAHLATFVDRAEQEGFITGLGPPDGMFRSLLRARTQIADVNVRTQRAYDAVDGLGAQRMLQMIKATFG